VFRQLTTLVPANWLYLQGLADAQGNQGQEMLAVLQ